MAERVTPQKPSRAARVTLVVVLSAASALAAWLTTPRSPAAPPSDVAVPARPTGALTLALVGDAAIALPLDLRDPGVQAVATQLQQASVTIANFELASAAAEAADMTSGPPRWPTATPTAAADLRALGVSAVSLANDHVFDRGADGLAALQAQLTAAGVAFAGAGENLEAARAPAIVTTPDGAVAVVGVTLSFHEGARATARRGDIVGRAGVNGLRYTRRLRVDPLAFAGLKAAFPPPAFAANPDGRTWSLHGLTVEPAATGGMAIVPDADDLAALAAAVREARARAAVVVVNLHAHEPGVAIDEVPAWLRDVAHAAIDAGADIVQGHGPHRLRGIEIHRGRPIFYSLGSLVFPVGAVTPQAAGPLEDHRWDIGSPVAAEGAAVVDFGAPVWWQSVAAFVRIESGRVAAIDLQALDLGAGRDVGTRGRPAVADPAVAAAVYGRLQALSASLGTTLTMHKGRAGVTIP